MAEVPRKPQRRRALLLGCTHFADRGLPDLRSPTTDVRRLAEVLGDPRGSGYEVISHLDLSSHEARVAIDRFFADADKRDLYVVYFSGHGVLDAAGNLHFAFTDTEKELLSSTAVASDWIRNRIEASGSRSTVVLVDCCFSGRFMRGMRSRAGEDANVASLVGELPPGSGIAVLTASDETGFSFEEADQLPGVETELSYFTEALVTGIGTGAADADGDGLITVDELYYYVYDRVRSGGSPQLPKKLGYGEGRVVVALTARRAIVPSPPLPAPPRPLANPVAPPRRPAPEVTDPALATERLAAMSPREAAAALSVLDPRTALRRVGAMEPERAGAVLAAMRSDHAAAILGLHGLQPQRAAKIVAAMPAARAEAVLHQIAETNPTRSDELSTALRPRPAASPVIAGPSHAKPAQPSAAKTPAPKTVVRRTPASNDDFAHYRNVSPARLAAELAGKPPTDVIVILVRLDPVTAAAALAVMPPERAGQILNCIPRADWTTETLANIAYQDPDHAAAVRTAMGMPPVDPHLRAVGRATVPQPAPAEPHDASPQSGETTAEQVTAPPAEPIVADPAPRHARPEPEPEPYPEPGYTGGQPNVDPIQRSFPGQPYPAQAYQGYPPQPLDSYTWRASIQQMLTTQGTWWSPQQVAELFGGFTPAMTAAALIDVDADVDRVAYVLLRVAPTLSDAVLGALTARKRRYALKVRASMKRQRGSHGIPP